MKASQKACEFTGCPAFSCDDHRCLKRTQGVHQPPPTKDKFRRGKYSRETAYSSARWRRVRKNQLAREPLCQRCLSFSLITPATVADHVLPHRGDPQLFWQHDNLQSLCNSCHSFKTNEENKGVLNDYRDHSCND